MGFKEDAIAFKRDLPDIDEIELTPYDRNYLNAALREAIRLKNEVESLEAEFYKAKEYLGSMQRKIGVPGFRCGRIAFSAFKRTSTSGKEYTVNTIEELPA